MRTVTTVPVAGLLALVLSAPTAEAQKVFEGVITYEMTSAGQSMQVKQMARGSKIRQEVEGPMGPMVMLVDAGEGTVTTIMPTQKMYMTMDMDAMANMRQMQQAQQNQPDPEDFKATGRTETIAGHSCEHYTYAGDDGTTVDACIATGLGFLPFSSPGAMGSRGSALPGMNRMEEWQKLFPEGFVPLSMEMTAQGQQMTMRATSVERTSLSDDLFRIPEGYTKMSMPGSGE